MTLLVFCAEGDNIPDAMILLYFANIWLRMKVNKVCLCLNVNSSGLGRINSYQLKHLETLEHGSIARLHVTLFRVIKR